MHLLATASTQAQGVPPSPIHRAGRRRGGRISLGATGVLLLALVWALAGAAPARAHGLELVSDHIDRGPAIPAQLSRPLARAAATRSWCPASSDAAANASSGPDAGRPRYEVVYVYPSDRADRVERVAPEIDAALAAAQQSVADEAKGLRSVRFHRGTPCSATGLAVGVVALPKSRAGYVVDGVPDLQAVRSAVWLAIGERHPAARDVLIYADYLGGDSGLLGQGEMWQGPDADDKDDSVYDDGGLSAVVYAPEDDADFLASLPSTLLHEVGHTLGAVSPNAPNGSPGFHCDDGTDVMCYDDGTLKRPMFDRCASLETAVGARFDCGQDDYFNPNPAPGSYLATHLNIFDSAFLASCGELGGACTGSPVAAPTSTVTTGKTQTKSLSTLTRKQTRTERRRRARLRAQKQRLARQRAIRKQGWTWAIRSERRPKHAKR